MPTDSYPEGVCDEKEELINRKSVHSTWAAVLIPLTNVDSGNNRSVRALTQRKKVFCPEAKTPCQPGPQLTASG